MDDMTSSHSEKCIYSGCIRLMNNLVDEFYSYLETIGIDVSELSEDERFRVSYYPTEIVETLFLSHTSHSGGTSQRMKCAELGIDTNKMEDFDFSSYLDD